MPPALLQAGCLVVGLVSLPICQILLAAFTPPERASGIRGTLFHDVDVGALQHLLPGCDITAVTAGKPHRVIYSTFSKDGRHRVSSVPPNHFAPVLTAPTAANLALKGIPPADTLDRSSALRTEQDSGKQAELTHTAPPLHSLKNSQETHCKPGDATQSSRCTPATNDSMLWNNRLCCLPVTGG